MQQQQNKQQQQQQQQQSCRFKANLANHTGGLGPTVQHPHHFLLFSAMRPSQQLLSSFSLPMILLSLLVTALFWSSSSAFQIIAMGRNSCAEVGTCQYLVHNGRLHEDDYCPSCRKTLKFGISYLSRNSELWKGVCFRKYPPVDGSYVPRNRLLEEGRSRRVRKQTNTFVAQPSKGKMGFEHSGKSYDRPILQRIRNDLANTTIDRAIAERYVRIDNEDQENDDLPQKKRKQVTVTLPNGGKSKASRSKQRQTLGAIINGMTKALAKDTATPTGYRAEGMENAVKRAPLLPSKKQAENETGKLQLLADVF
jgi:hypothetical protein